MPKLYSKTVSKCADCPMACLKPDGPAFCEEANKFIPRDHGDTIPDWCPLPDAPEQCLCPECGEQRLHKPGCKEWGIDIVTSGDYSNYGIASAAFEDSRYSWEMKPPG